MVLDIQDWTMSIRHLGDVRDWKPLPERNALRMLTQVTGFPLQEGIDAKTALHAGYAALAAATPEERASCYDLAGLRALQRKQQETQERKQRLAQELRRSYLDKVADSTQWRLLAGEDTEVVATGTRAQCEAHLHEVRRCKRDPSGTGCWKLLAPDGSEAMSGTFDKDCYY